MRIEVDWSTLPPEGLGFHKGTMRGTADGRPFEIFVCEPATADYDAKTANIIQRAKSYAAYPEISPVVFRWLDTAAA